MLTAEQLGPFGQRLATAMKPWMTPSLEVVCAMIAAMGFNQALQLVEEEGAEGQPGWLPQWGRLLDPDLCPGPDLPYLGQYVGVPIPVGASEHEARALVKGEAGQGRGTPASVKTQIERSISTFWAAGATYQKGQLVRHEPNPGEVLCYEATATFTAGTTFETTHLALININSQYELIERENPVGEERGYHFLIIVHGNQLTPENNAGRLEANVNAVKPAGLIMHVIQTEEPLATDPLIDEGTLAINEVGEAEILTATLANIT